MVLRAGIAGRRVNGTQTHAWLVLLANMVLAAVVAAEIAARAATLLRASGELICQHVAPRSGAGLSGVRGPRSAGRAVSGGCGVACRRGGRNRASWGLAELFRITSADERLGYAANCGRIRPPILIYSPADRTSSPNAIWSPGVRVGSAAIVLCSYLSADNALTGGFNRYPRVIGLYGKDDSLRSGARKRTKTRCAS